MIQLRVDLRADGLRDPEHDPPDERPHSEPMPPMTTASNAKISCAGPAYGSKVERIPRKVPASAAVATRDRRPRARRRPAS